MKKRNYKITNQLLFIILPVSIIPIFIVTIISINSQLNYLTKQNKDFYTNIMKLVLNNIDTFYKQYTFSISDITNLPNFQKIVNVKEFKSANEEREFSDKIGEIGNSPKADSIRKYVMNKIDGSVNLIELDKKSLINNTNHLIHQFSQEYLNINLPSLLKEPLLAKLINSSDEKISFGMVNKSSINGFEIEKRPIFVYPYYENGQKIFNKFILVILSYNFIEKIFEDIDKLQYGTLYLLDSNNNIIFANHPSSSDDFEFDNTKKTYILNDKNSNFNENEDFENYIDLNSDSNILNNKDVKYIINNENHDLLNYIYFNNKKYLTIVEKSYLSQTKLIFFLPIRHIYNPTYKLIYKTLIITLFIILFLILIAVLLSKYITKPIEILTKITK
ncbi:MAG TPA: hypothetical protein PK771_04850, partial [Spirochaetota bacterium]|nr:hypothetical protein [Spirochaetota bacterium]